MPDECDPMALDLERPEYTVVSPDRRDSRTAAAFSCYVDDCRFSSHVLSTVDTAPSFFVETSLNAVLGDWENVSRVVPDVTRNNGGLEF